MLDEKDIRFLREIFSSYNYIMTTAQLDAERLFYRDIQRMLEAGVIEKVKRGYYHWVEGYGGLYCEPWQIQRGLFSGCLVHFPH